VERADIRVVRGQVADVAENLTPIYADEVVVDATGKLIMPGFVAAHTHLAELLALGIQSPRPSKDVISQHQTADSLYYGTLFGAVEAIKSGVTTVIDSVSAANCVEGSLEVVAHALDEVGIRGVLSYATSDLEGGDASREALAEQKRFLSKYRGPRCAGLVGGLASYALEAETLQALCDLAARFGVGLHLEVGATEDDAMITEKKFGLGLAERLFEAGALVPRTLLANGAHLAFEESAMAREAGCWFAYCPRSNMLEGTGHADLEHLPPDRTVLGTDSMSLHFLGELETAFLKMRDDHHPMSVTRVAHMVTNTQRLAAQCLGVSLGTFHSGAAADLVMMDYNPPMPLSEANLHEHVVHGLPSTKVCDVMVQGEFLLRDSKLTNPNLEAALQKARDQTLDLWRRINRTGGENEALEDGTPAASEVNTRAESSAQPI
jgi:cytosine/adenosine deaminase-related metal-dependent hydrolase